MRFRLALVLALSLCLLVLADFLIRRQLKPVPPAQPADLTSPPVAGKPAAQTRSGLEATDIFAHNLMLRKGPNFRFYVRWLRGTMARTNRNVNPSFDDPESFSIEVQAGVLRANIGDLTNFMNASAMKDSPLKNISITGDGEKVKLKGTVHKILPLPIELDGIISAAPGNLVKVHVNKINVLKVPLKGMLGLFHVNLADMVHPKGVQGINIVDNDIFFDTQKLLPPPRLRGQLTAVRIANPDLEEVYGNAAKEVDTVEQWRNFIRLRNGTIDFGKLTMHHVDLIMIDVSSDSWFDLDLSNYQTQLVNGYTRMTPVAGLQIFMPDLDKIPKKNVQDINIQWMKNRNLPPPPDVVKK